MRKSAMESNLIAFLFLTSSVLYAQEDQPDVGSLVHTASQEADFREPPQNYHPETWFHLIGGNVNKPGLTADLEAIHAAGIFGIQLFHGSGSPWPGITPQVTALSSTWDDMIAHVADETRRLDLQFTMQNCPGWATSGGPWIEPGNAMRHLIWSRQNITGGGRVSMQLERPQPSEEDWRDYRDVAVMAFPTPEGDADPYLIPSAIRSNRDDLPWMDVIAGKADIEIELKPGGSPTWIEVEFTEKVNLRTIELPPVNHFVQRRMFSPQTTIHVQAMTNGEWVEVISRDVPRGTWQDREIWVSLVLALPDYKASTFRITFDSEHLLQLPYLRFLSAARVHDWRGQAGYALRSMDRSATIVQDAVSWVRADAIVDISDNMDPGGMLTWDVPDGEWTVVRFGHVNTGAKNKPAPPEATGFECDKFSSNGVEQHFAGYIGRLTEPGGPADDGRLKGMLIDSWECHTQTWTPAMERKFADRRGYALRQWLPALAGWVIEDHLTSERFLRDWRATISDLLVNNYYGRLAELARERGLKLYFETALGDVSPGDILQYYSKADVPMCEFWIPNDPHRGGLETKPVAPAASAAHIYGKPRLAAEAFTNAPVNWNEHPFSLKHFADFHFAQGVNHLIFHTYTHNPDLSVVPGTSFGRHIGTPFLRGQTWWKYMPLFIEYLSRCQYLLQQGRPVADVLWYLGDDLDHKPRQNAPFPDGHRFDYLNQDALLHRIEVVDGKLQTPEGVTWEVLWLPEDNCQRLTPETLVRLKQLLHDGATVVGGAPLQNASLSGGPSADELFSLLVKELWGTTPASSGDRRIGKGRLLWGNDLGTTLSQLGIVPDVIGTRAATWFHRREEGRDIYFVAADRLAPLSANISFRAKGHPELWDPVTGSVKPVVVFHQEPDHTVIPLELPAAGSVFVVFNNDQNEPLFTRVVHNGSTLVDASDLTKVDQGLLKSIYGLRDHEEVQPWVDNPFPAGNFIDDGRRFLAWEDGTYQFIQGNNEVAATTVNGNQVLTMDGAWGLTFPAGWDTPEKVQLTDLLPWSALQDRAAQAFSGTATYSSKIDLKGLDATSSVLLDLGRVADIAEVTINGQQAAALWAPPFRMDITPHVKNGTNRIEVKVTNTWRNRLAYDASLPEDQQKTWTTNAPPADAPLQDAGLFGPVTVRVGKTFVIDR